jgi:hypothetical protein
LGRSGRIYRSKTRKASAEKKNCERQVMMVDAREGAVGCDRGQKMHLMGFSIE